MRAKGPSRGSSVTQGDGGGVGFEGMGYDFRRTSQPVASHRYCGTPDITKELPQKGTKRHEEGGIDFCTFEERLIGRRSGRAVMRAKGPSRGSSVTQGDGGGVGFEGMGYDFRRTSQPVASHRYCGTPDITKELPQKGTKRHEEGGIDFCTFEERLIGRRSGKAVMRAKGPARGSSVTQGDGGGVGFEGMGCDFRRSSQPVPSHRYCGTPDITKELPQKGTERHEEGGIDFCTFEERLIGRRSGRAVMRAKGPSRGSSVTQGDGGGVGFEGMGCDSRRSSQPVPSHRYCGTADITKELPQKGTKRHEEGGIDFCTFEERLIGRRSGRAVMRAKDPWRGSSVRQRFLDRRGEVE